MAMKASELRELTVDELKGREQELAEKLFTFRLQKVTGQLEDTSKLQQARRDLDRVLTVMREKNAR